MNKRKKQRIMTLEDKIFCAIGKFVGLCFVASIWVALFIWIMETGTTCY